MSIGAILVLAVHYSLVSILCLYGAHRVYHSNKAKRLMAHIRQMPRPNALPAKAYPHMTVQAPMYNEKFVATRIIDAIAAFEYPRDKLHIQVIDDSTDESVERVAERVAYYKSLGLDIDHVRRPNRSGYKAVSYTHLTLPTKA